MSWVSNRYSVLTATRSLKVMGWLLIPLYFLFIVALYGTFLYAPTEQVMGEVQRIFYFHVAAGWNSFLAFLGVFVGGIGYLVTRKRVWDGLAFASAEIGVLYTTIVLTTGPLWAKPVWNTWWPWGDPRVMTELVLWLLYVAYLVLRSSLPEGEKKYRYCAVFGIISFLDVPIVWFSIRWWRTIHPVVIKSTGAALDPEMIQVLVVSVVSFTALYMTLLLLRLSMNLDSALADELEQQIMEQKVTQS